MEELNEPVRELAYATPAKEQFLRGKTPKELRRRGSPDARKATNGDIEKFVPGLSERLYYSLYWTVYRYRRYDDNHGNLGRVDYNSLILDTLFLELECHDCGVLCSHTMEEGKWFTSWCQDNNIDPLIVYSGGKSLHIYLFFNDTAHDIEDSKKHETIKEANSIVAKIADLKLYDPVVARTGRSQVARLPGARNSDSGYFCNIVATPANYKEFQGMKVNNVLSLAEDKEERTIEKFFFWRNNIKEHGNDRLPTLVEKAADKVTKKRSSHQSTSGRGAMGGDDGDRPPICCSTVTAILEGERRPPKGQRYYHAMVLVDYYLGGGLSVPDTIGKLQRWNQKYGIQLPSTEVRRAVRNRAGQGDYNRRPCNWLRAIGESCPQCHR